MRRIRFLQEKGLSATEIAARANNTKAFNENLAKQIPDYIPNAGRRRLHLVGHLALQWRGHSSLSVSLVPMGCNCCALRLFLRPPVTYSMDICRNAGGS